MVAEKLKTALTRRRIQLVLGCLWLLNALLQMQPRMFKPDFAHTVLLSASQNQPWIIGAPIRSVVHIVLIQPAFFNVIFVLIQLTIALLIFSRNNTWVRRGLIISIIWALLIWYIGEGLGGIFAGNALILTGAPGAALFYALIGLAALPLKHKQNGAQQPDYRLNYVWMALWLGGAVLLLASHDSPFMLATMIIQNATGAPHWLYALDAHTSNWLIGKSDLGILFTVVIYILISLSALFKRRIKLIGVTLGIIISLVYWIVGQNLGGFYSGLATDVSTAPLVILLGLALFASAETKLY